MPWPERDIVTRLLAALVGGPLGAIVGFFVAFGWVRLVHDVATSSHADPPIVVSVVAGAIIASAAAFWRGDAVIHLLLRTIGGWRPRVR